MIRNFDTIDVTLRIYFWPNSKVLRGLEIELRIIYNLDTI